MAKPTPPKKSAKAPPPPVSKSSPKAAATAQGKTARPAPKAPVKTAPKAAPKAPPAKTKAAPAPASKAKPATPPLPVPSTKPVPKPAKPSAKLPELPNFKKNGKPSDKKAKPEALAPSKKGSNTPLPPTLVEAKEKHLLRVGKHTPAIFKPLRKGNTPVFFTLEDVREHLKVRKSTGDTPAPMLSRPANAAPKAAAPKGPKVDINSIKIAPKVVGVASLEDILGFSPGAKSGPDMHDESMIPAAWRKYYRMLMDLRDHVGEGLQTLSNETLKRGTNDDAGDTSAYGQHLGDAGAETFDRDFALNMLSNEQEAMNEIDAALDRIFKGTYGLCEVTGKAIPSDRLAAVPFTRFTLDGQKEYEMRKRRREQRGNLFVEAEEPAAEPVEEI